MPNYHKEFTTMLMTKRILKSPFQAFHKTFLEKHTFKNVLCTGNFFECLLAISI